MASERFIAQSSWDRLRAAFRRSLSASFNFNFEPSKTKLLEALLPRQLKAQLYRVLLESQAAELAARMNAMANASDNAKELRKVGG